MPIEITSRLDEVEVFDFIPPNEDTGARRHDIAARIQLELTGLGIHGVVSARNRSCSVPEPFHVP
ncbi:MAG: hypothetical protein ABI595_15690, partial [Actinomycetota bacterium]